MSSVVFKYQPGDELKKVNQSTFRHLNISVPLAQEGDGRNSRTAIDWSYTSTRTLSRNLIKLLIQDKGFSCTHLCVTALAHKDPFFSFPPPSPPFPSTPYIFFFLVQFNSCPNLPSNYANEFVVGGSPSRLSGDLGSLGWEQKVSLAHVWQRKSSSRKEVGQRKKREEAATEEQKRVQRLTQFS